MLDENEMLAWYARHGSSERTRTASNASLIPRQSRGLYGGEPLKAAEIGPLARPRRIRCAKPRLLEPPRCCVCAA